MIFQDLVENLKKLPSEEVRKEAEGYYEFVIGAKNLPLLYPVLEIYFGVPFKPAGIAPSDQAKDVTKRYGSIQKQQTLYYLYRDGLSNCAMIWPWGDGSRSTVKVAQGVLEGARPAL